MSFLAPHEYSQIPFKLKALKLIINGLKHDGEAATIAKAGDLDAASSNGVRIFYVVVDSFNTMN
jgi:hypothetical protein